VGGVGVPWSCGGYRRPVGLIVAFGFFARVRVCACARERGRLEEENALLVVRNALRVGCCATRRAKRGIKPRNALRVSGRPRFWPRWRPWRPGFGQHPVRKKESGRLGSLRAPGQSGEWGRSPLTSAQAVVGSASRLSTNVSHRPSRPRRNREKLLLCHEGPAVVFSVLDRSMSARSRRRSGTVGGSDPASGHRLPGGHRSDQSEPDHERAHSCPRVCADTNSGATASVHVTPLRGPGSTL
jgi:hypothetical protein